MATPRKKPEDKKKTGPKGKYDPKYHPQLVKFMRRSGLDLEQIAFELKIANSTLSEWAKKYPEISEALKISGNFIDSLVEDSLLKRALGYEFEEVTKEPLYNVVTGDKIRDEEGEPIIAITKIVKKQMAPDTTAQIFWLKNRQKERWRDKHEYKHEIPGVNSGIEKELQENPAAQDALKTLFRLKNTVGSTSQD